MKDATLLQRLQYRFDNFMARGTSALLYGLFALSALIIFSSTIIIWATCSEPGEEGFLELAWMAL